MYPYLPIIQLKYIKATFNCWLNGLIALDIFVFVRNSILYLSIAYQEFVLGTLAVSQLGFGLLMTALAPKSYVK